MTNFCPGNDELLSSLWLTSFCPHYGERVCDYEERLFCLWRAFVLIMNDELLSWLWMTSFCPDYNNWASVPIMTSWCPDYDEPLFWLWRTFVPIMTSFCPDYNELLYWWSWASAPLITSFCLWYNEFRLWLGVRRQLPADDRERKAGVVSQ